MSMKLGSVAAILIGSATAVASGQSLIDAENLLFSPPKDFKVGFQSNRDNRVMTEWVPAVRPLSRSPFHSLNARCLAAQCSVSPRYGRDSFGEAGTTVGTYILYRVVSGREAR